MLTRHCMPRRQKESTVFDADPVTGNDPRVAATYARPRGAPAHHRRDDAGAAAPAAGDLLRSTPMSLPEREELLAALVWGEAAGLVVATLLAGAAGRRLAS